MVSAFDQSKRYTFVKAAVDDRVHRFSVVTFVCSDLRKKAGRRQKVWSSVANKTVSNNYPKTWSDPVINVCGD